MKFYKTRTYQGQPLPLHSSWSNNEVSSPFPHSPQIHNQLYALIFIRITTSIYIHAYLFNEYSKLLICSTCIYHEFTKIRFKGISLNLHQSTFHWRNLYFLKLHFDRSFLGKTVMVFHMRQEFIFVVDIWNFWLVTNIHFNMFFFYLKSI